MNNDCSERNLSFQSKIVRDLSDLSEECTPDLIEIARRIGQFTELSSTELSGSHHCHTMQR